MQRANAVVDLITGQMPPNAPGSITYEDGAKLLALILRRNGVHSGNEVLPNSSEALAHVVLPAPTNQFGELAGSVESAIRGMER